ncbi:unnamed protein product [Fraxinus pennsylvanica]|uniref:Uncharacterized protein n=1 Tax=Fraxinus pennsylvanica TaxID=56036 RepID=A0AAD1ZDW3_9LAMI|nr:unnamed protein product [Fraxinus pennsylvanica]
MLQEGFERNSEGFIVATNACKGGWAKENRSIFLCDEPTPLWADFQLASLRALLASFLSPGPVCQPYLSLGLELFLGGMQETGSRLSEYCKHSLLTLEVLIHPRTLPLVDFSSTIDNYEGLSSKFPKNIPFQTRTLGKDIVEPESDDELYKMGLKEMMKWKKFKGVVSASGTTERIAFDRDDVMVEFQETNSADGDHLGEHAPNRVAGDYHEGHTSRIVFKNDALDPITKIAQVSNDTAMKSDIHEANAEKNVSGAKDGGFST